jgi:sugar (pentulose or hexulose) kinase
MISWGTTANVSVPVADPDPPDGIVLTRAAIDGWLLEGGVSAAGSLLAWLAKVTATDGLWDRAATSPPGARGVIALPWLGGARAPWWNDDVGAAWLNLGPAHDAADMARAAIEGVAIELGRCLVRAARDAEGIVLAGGGSASSLWAEILTAVTGLPAQRRRSPEAASAGAALLAAAGVGLELDVDRINPVVEEIVPDPALVEIYGVVRDASDAAAHAVIEL